MVMAAASSATQKLPVAAIVVAPTKPPSITRSPWAKFTTSMMPKIRVSPDATSARIMPLTRPLTVWMRIWSSGTATAQTPRYWWITV
jgi:hypothetical protein